MAQAKHSSHAAMGEHEHRVKGCEIFVGGLARNVTEIKIRELFSSYGEIVEVRMMKDHSGNSKGFCFVRFATKEAAFKAQKEKNGFTLQGKKIGVSLSADQDSLFLGNLRKDWSSDEFEKMVRQAFKDVVSVDLATAASSEDTSTGKRQQNRGFAFVLFSSHAAAARAYRVGSNPDFLLSGKWHPIVDWAEQEPEIDPEEMAKIKIAFVGSLPANADEEYLKKLFEPFGKLERVALSRKSHFPVGFVHFSKRSELDNAIKEMDGKTVQGPERGPKFKIQVSIARPVEKDRKRARDESQDKPYLDRHACDSSEDHKSKATRLKTSLEIDLPLITRLKELPESSAIAVLDQFILSASDGYDKGRHLAGLIAKHQVSNLRSNRNPSHLPGRTRDFALRDSELLLPSSTHVSSFDPFVPRSAGTASLRYDIYKHSPGLYAYPSSVSDDPLVPRTSLGKLGEMGSLSHIPSESSKGYRSYLASESHNSTGVERPQERPQVKFDPFTGQPYKFDPFTGEPIQQDTPPRRSGTFF
ncbi:uncharacterized protein LOC143856833 isoform X2 [Tasmannia lanceolata]|uniref:uncharacterized protein LOC143856833 isoform X2 n=1 Tax=Tasmannia lanceolata TaxID=3420 RepID=UPI004062C173